MKAVDFCSQKIHMYYMIYKLRTYEKHRMHSRFIFRQLWAKNNKNPCKIQSHNFSESVLNAFPQVSIIHSLWKCIPYSDTCSLQDFPYLFCFRFFPWITIHRAISLPAQSSGSRAYEYSFLGIGVNPLGILNC